MKDKNWEKEFDRKFGEEIVLSNWLDCPCCGRKEHRVKDKELPIKSYWFYKPIKSFIHQLLKAQKADLKKKVEGMKYYTEGTLLDVDQEQKEDGFNEACDKFIKLLED